MLTLSRHVNEAVVFAGRVIVTVVRLLPDRVEMTIRDTASDLDTSAVVGIGDSFEIGLGVRVTLLGVRASACGGPSARLGFETPPTASVSRKEVWDVIGGCGLDLYHPKADARPSMN